MAGVIDGDHIRNFPKWQNLSVLALEGTAPPCPFFHQKTQDNANETNLQRETLMALTSYNIVYNTTRNTPKRQSISVDSGHKRFP